MKTLNLGLFLVLAPVLAGQTVPGKPVQTTLATIREQPNAFKRVTVVFPVQFASLGRISNPFFTRFVPSEYANFYAWGDDQQIWDSSEYEDVFGMLFLSKLSPKLQELYRLRLYDRVEVRGVVQNTFQGTPWIEVVDFVPLVGRVDTTTLAHMYRGQQFMQQRRWQRAITEFTMAQAAEAPATVQLAAHRGLGLCFLRVGEAGMAVQHLRQVSSMNGGKDPEVDRLLSVAERTPGLELDREVDTAALKDHERPMWEAFASAKPVRRSTTTIR